MKTPHCSAEPFSETYYATGFKAWLHRHANWCDVELAVASPGGITYDSARLQVLLQPRGRDELPWGPPLTLAEETVPLAVFPGSCWQWGRVALPGDWKPETLRRSYLRIVPLCRSEITCSPPRSHDQPA